MRDVLRTGGSGVLILLIMFGGGFLLWVGVPVGTLWVGGHVQATTNSLGTAMAVMFLGAVASIVVIVFVLVWLNRKHIELREARGLESHGQTLLEGVMTISAGVALLGFGAWFFLFSGSSPLPTNLGY
jgi:membrane protein implicated in regulation of membrane protease activity